MYGEEALEESKTAVCFLSVFIRGGITMNNKSGNAIIAFLVCLILMISLSITGIFNLEGAILYFVIWTWLNTINNKSNTQQNNITSIQTLGSMPKLPKEPCKNKGSHMIKGFLKVKLGEDIVCTFVEADSLIMHDGYINFYNVRFKECIGNKRHLKLHESEQYAFSLSNIIESSIQG